MLIKEVYRLENSINSSAIAFRYLSNLSERL